MAHFEFYDSPPGANERIANLRFEMAFNRVLLSGYRLSALLGKANFNPNQPRVPSGNPDGGEWTRVPGWAKKSRRAQVARIGLTQRRGRG